MSVWKFIGTSVLLVWVEGSCWHYDNMNESFVVYKFGALSSYCVLETHNSVYSERYME